MVTKVKRDSKQYSFRIKPHETIGWGLTGWFINARYLPLRALKDSSLVLSMTEAVIIVTIIELMKEIELTLKERIYRFLHQANGVHWWAALPSRVQQNALNRHKWTVAQIGIRRAGSKHNIAWLSMGDVISIIGMLNKNDWVTCLDAESQRKKDFERALHRVKAFRDNYLAHPKPRRTSNYELDALCKAAHHLPQILRPNEWKEVLSLLDQIKVLPSDERMSFFREATGYYSPNRNYLRAWIKCPDLHEPVACTHAKKTTYVQAKWREHVIRLCADLDAGGYVFFGREESQ